MKRIEGNYYEHEGELYKKLKGTPRGYHIINEEGKQSWLRLKCTGSTRTDCTPQPNDSTDSTPVQPVQDTLDEVVKSNCTESTDVQGVQCTESTECNNTTLEPEEGDEGYGTIGDIDRRKPRTPVRPYYEAEEKEVEIDPEYGLPF